MTFLLKNDTTFIVYKAYTRSDDGKSLLNMSPVFLDDDNGPSFEDTGKVIEAD